VSSEVARVAGETAGATLGGLVGFAVGGPVGAIVGAAVTPALEKWASLCIAEFKRRGVVVVGAAAVGSGLSEDEVLDAVLSDPDLQPLLSRILEAIAHTDSKEKLLLLGTVLGEAINNRPNRLDEDFLIVAALDDLEPVHLRVMELLEQPQAKMDDLQPLHLRVMELLEQYQDMSDSQAMRTIMKGTLFVMTLIKRVLPWKSTRVDGLSEGRIEDLIVGVSQIGLQGGLAALVRHGLVRPC
jgi:hypothetical protein